MSNLFVRVLVAGILVLSVGSFGVLARSATGSGGSGPDTSGIPPTITRVAADVPAGRYGPGKAIGLTATLNKDARGSVVAYLSSGVAVALQCEAATCKGEYWVGAGHATDRLDVLFFSGSLMDADGNRNDSLEVPAGANLADNVTLKIGTDSVKVPDADKTLAALPSRF